MTSQNDQAERLNNAVRRQDWPNSRPRDAATLIIIDRREGEPRVLMGRRHDAHVFLPGKFVFPGGRISTSDSRLRAGDDLDPSAGKNELSRRPINRGNWANDVAERSGRTAE